MSGTLADTHGMSLQNFMTVETLIAAKYPEIGEDWTGIEIPTPGSRESEFLRGFVPSLAGTGKLPSFLGQITTGTPGATGETVVFIVRRPPNRRHDQDRFAGEIREEIFRLLELSRTVAAKKLSARRKAEGN